MREQDVHHHLSHVLREWHPENDTLFINELDLSGLDRADFAAVNGALWGYEIKSDRDTLCRLPMQVTVYSQVLDYSALVVAERHKEQALSPLPAWWQVNVASAEANRRAFP